MKSKLGHAKTREKIKIVSLLPLALAHDSRSMKISGFFSRAGFDSEVYQHFSSPENINLPKGVTVNTLWPVPFNLFRSITSSGWRVDDDLDFQYEGHPLRRARLTTLIKEILHFFLFVGYYLLFRPFVGLFQRPRADVIYLHEFRLFPLALVWRMLTGATIVYDAHDYYPGVRDPKSLSVFWKRLFLPTLVGLEAVCVSFADTVVTTSSGIAELMRDRFGKKPLVVRNCHDESGDVALHSDLRKRFGVDEGSFVVTVIGHRKPAQHLAAMLSAIRQLNKDGMPTHLVLLGRGYGGVLDQASKLGIDRFVHSSGPVPSGEIVPLLRQSNAVALPYVPRNSHYNNALPNGFFQSVAAGTPIMYPHLERLEEVVGDSKIGLRFDPLDMADTASAIRSMRSDHILLSNCRDNMKALARELNWEEEAKPLGLLVERILSRRNNVDEF